MKAEPQQTEQNLTSGPIAGHIRRLAVPASVGVIFHTAYNVTDTYFSGLISAEALAALSLSFPVFFIIISFGAGLQTGATALIGHALGAKDRDQARLYACQAISFAAVLSLALTALGLTAAPTLFRILGAEEQYLYLSLTYINPIICALTFFVCGYAFNAALVASGDTKSYRNVLIMGAVLNIGLDPWFMFGGLGLPALGLAGVAWATAFIQGLAMGYLAWRTVRTGLSAREDLTLLKPRPAVFAELARQGLPAGFSSMTVALGIFVITYYFSLFGQAAVAAYGVATRVEQIVLMPTQGLNQATLAIVSQNNGANLFGRIRETTRTAQTVGTAMMIIGGLILFFAGRTLMSLFTDEAAVVETGSAYLRVAAFILPSYIFLYVNVSALQGLKHPAFAVWIGLARQIVGPIIAFQILAVWLDMGVNGVFWGILIVTWSAAVVTLVITRRIIGRLEERRRNRGAV